jgi:uncharacterized membrane protein HdeD (DUF308 family)
MELIRRAKGKTPKFFRILRNVGLSIAAVGTLLLTAPVVLPAIATTIGGYMVVAGGIASAVSQLTEKEDEKDPKTGK